MANNKTYYWEGNSNDGAYEVRSNQNFDTIAECYADMRDAVLEKMKWNTNYDEDFDVRDENNEPITHEENHIHYNVDFFPRKIVHESFSGIYTYLIKEEKSFVERFDEMWKDKIIDIRNFAYNLPNICLSTWVTDCGDDYDLWGKWFETYYGNVEETFFSCDIILPENIKWTKEVEDFISSKLNSEPYDCQGTQHVFWRIECVGVNDIAWLKSTLSSISEGLTPIICNKRDLLLCYTHLTLDNTTEALKVLADILNKNGVQID